MQVLSVVGPIAGGIVSVVAFLALPLLLRAGIGAAAIRLGVDEYRQVPAINKLVIPAGLLACAPIVAEFAASRTGENGLLNLEVILAAQGPWALNYLEFIQLRVAAFPALLVDVLRAAVETPERTLSLLTLVGLACSVTACIVSFLIFAPPQAIAASAISILRVILIAFTGFYIVIGLAWLVNELGVFVALIPLIYIRPPIQFVRH